MAKNEVQKIKKVKKKFFLFFLNSFKIYLKKILLKSFLKKIF